MFPLALSGNPKTYPVNPGSGSLSPANSTQSALCANLKPRITTSQGISSANASYLWNRFSYSSGLAWSNPKFNRLI